MSRLNLKVILTLVIWAAAMGAASVCSDTSTSPEFYIRGSTDQANILEELTSAISKCSEIYDQGSSQFDNATLRWSLYEAPRANIVVIPCKEEDVAQIVKLANKKHISFLTINTRHGAITTLGKMDSGIFISLEKLRRIKISKDGKSATFGGGVRSKEVTEKLWQAGKQAVTGSCECVSLLGPGLGGGHGWLQGRHGLISDQFLSLNVVLANGTMTMIDSGSDLWWGIKGAGHNFGIVTSVTTKIYDIEYPTWAVTKFTFKSEKLEDLYTATNAHFIGSDKRVDIINWWIWMKNTTLDSTNPVIVLYLLQEGVETIDERWMNLFLRFEPLAVESQVGTYPDLSPWTNGGLTALLCQKIGRSYERFPVYLNSYNTTALREGFDLFAKNNRDDSPFDRVICLFEGYSTRGVQALPLDASAFPFRDAHVLGAMSISYSANAELDEKAAKLGEEWRKIMHRGTGLKSLRAYVNYVSGDEGIDGWYGTEAWRQKRLKSLKQKYDPEGKFIFYAPIV